ncbi:MAG: ferredoxin-type protein NapF [Desulfovibrionaceae bacterium]|jgi:ferredoxin-type protein NapF|nr:ferredoxin-type protein NapF [Desulfovibrionaceae bacterium]
MIDPRRRSFLRGRIAQAAPAVQRPPWALPQARFNQQCDRCRACVQACPHGVLRLGDGGFPEMDFSRRGCDFCGACERACKPRALDRAAAPHVAAWPLWQAQVAPHCLALNKVECRICADACDARAIRFKPAPGGISRMQLDPAACTACGDCVSVCPAGAIAMAARATA